MKAVLFGASGMVGQGVLRECLLDPGVERVLSVARSPSATVHPKFKEVVHRDFLDFSTLEAEVTGFDACIYCLGVSAAGLGEEAYRRVTHDFTLAAARTLSKVNPGMTFVFVSGAGADSSSKGLAMWARVKGATENDLMKLPFKAVYAFRPAGIQPVHGIKSRTLGYRLFYGALFPVMPLLRVLLPNFMTTTEKLGRALIKAARDGAPKSVLEPADINQL